MSAGENSAPALLEVDGLSAGYRGAPTLRGITLPPLVAGETLGLIGPNAAGKSTLMRCLAGDMAARGVLRLEGRDAADIPRRDWRRRVAHMPQTPPQPSALSPYELLLSAVGALGLRPEAGVEDLLTRLGLADAALAPLSTLSGGKRQMVGLALALVRDPLLLLLDEPTAALDLRWRLEVLAQVREHVANGAAAIVALHDLDLAARSCDRLALLAEGRLVAAGTPEEVLTPERIAEVYGVAAEIERAADGAFVIRPVAALTPSP